MKWFSDKDVWTWGGKYFGYIEDRLLWTYTGKNVGELEGKIIYDTNGDYLGEVIDDMLIYKLDHSSLKGVPFTPCGDRLPVKPYRDYKPYVMMEGFRDFPPVEFFDRDNIACY